MLVTILERALLAWVIAFQRVTQSQHTEFIGHVEAVIKQVHCEFLHR